MYWQIFVAAYFVFSLTLNATWRTGIILRYPFGLSIVTYFVVLREVRSDPIVFEENLIGSLILFSFIEFLIYINVKSQAQLFKLAKQTEMQQNELINIMDLVPDSVFICSKSKDDTGPVGLYANFKMNQFFGRNVINGFDKSHEQNRSNDMNK